MTRAEKENLVPVWERITIMRKRICTLTLAVLLSFSIAGCAAKKSAGPVFQPSAKQTALETENIRILDENRAVFSAPLPGTAGREGTDLTLEQQGDMLYLHANSRVFLGEGSIPDMERVDSVVIPDSGYAQWFRVSSLADRNMTVRLPENSGFYVYDARGSITASSVMWGDTSAQLPEGGYLVFIGEPGMIFELTFSE